MVRVAKRYRFRSRATAPLAHVGGPDVGRYRSDATGGGRPHQGAPSMSGGLGVGRDGGRGAPVIAIGATAVTVPRTPFSGSLPGSPDGESRMAARKWEPPRVTEGTPSRSGPRVRAAGRTSRSTWPPKWWVKGPAKRRRKPRPEWWKRRRRAASHSYGMVGERWHGSPAC